MNVDVKALQKEMKSLGILNIEADGELTSELLQDAIDTVKENPLDFKELAAEAKAKKARY
jgi:hypothetical protein